jgi:hypothetical protein
MTATGVTVVLLILVLTENLRYPNDINRSLNETSDDKIRKYRADYNNSPPNNVSFMTAIPSTSGRLHSEFVRLLFLQAHRETDRFFCNFRSSTSVNRPLPVPLPPSGFLCPAQKQGWPDSR